MTNPSDDAEYHANLKRDWPNRKFLPVDHQPKAAASGLVSKSAGRSPFQIAGTTAHQSTPNTMKPLLTEAEFQKTTLEAIELIQFRQDLSSNRLKIASERHEKEVRDLRSVQAPPGLRTACETALDASPQLRLSLRVYVLRILGMQPDPKNADECELYKRTVINPGSGLGAAAMPIEVATTVLNLMAAYGAWRTLGYVPLSTGKTKVAQVSVEPYTAWITPTNQGATALIPGSITGGATQTDCPQMTCLLEVANPVLEDGKMTWEGAALEAIVTSSTKALDLACFAATGADNASDGLQTGIFAHGSVTNFSAGTGRTAASSLALVDFAGTIASVSSAALQRACRWWINPAFLPKLMLIVDNNQKVLQPPATPGGEWMLAGFPVTWTAAAPAVDGAGKSIAAFGRGESFMVAIARDVNIERSQTQPAAFTSNLTLLRATMRAHALMRDAASFAILKTAAA